MYRYILNINTKMIKPKIFKCIDIGKYISITIKTNNIRIASIFLMQRGGNF